MLADAGYVSEENFARADTGKLRLLAPLAKDPGRAELLALIGSIDVLLAKKSGYEVCAEIKADPQLAKLPVVLIWSSFMDVDEKKAVASGATRRLEKPFDAETLRGLIRELVPVTGSNAITYSTNVPGTAGTDALQLVQRETTVRRITAAGEQRSVCQIERPSPGNLTVIAHVTGEVIDIVRPGGSGGTQQKRTILTQDSNGSLGEVWVDMGKTTNLFRNPDRNPPSRQAAVG